MPNPADRIREIEERVGEATAGPWTTARFARSGHLGVCIPEGCRLGDEVIRISKPDNAEFIAHARQDVPWLLELVRDLQSELRKVLRRSTQAGAAEVLDELLNPKSCNTQTKNESERK